MRARKTRPRLEVLERRALMAAGQLDPTFGNGGEVTTALTSSGGEQVTQNSLLVQPNGDIVAAGEAGGMTYQAMVRYTPTGALDPTFGSGGIVLQQNGSGTTNEINALAIQSNGELVAAIYSPKTANALKRFTTTGQLDTTFGKSGVATDPTLGYSFMSDIAIQPADGKIIVVGEADGATSADFAVSRFNTNGTLDTTFGTKGNVLTSFNGHGTGAYAVAIQSNGEIVAAGKVSSRSEPVWQAGTGEFALARYNSNGSLDSTFGSGGLVTTPAGALPLSATLSGIAIQPDGKIVAVGNGSFVGTSGGGQGVVLVRFNADGSLDTTFGNGGIDLQPATVGMGGSPGEGVALESNGEIVTSGLIQVSASQWANEVTVFNPDGSLDTNFGGTGVVITPVPATGMGGAYSVAVQPADGNIVVGGNSGSQFFLARYIGDVSDPGPAVAVAHQSGRAAGIIYPASVSAANAGAGPLGPLVLDMPDFWNVLGLKKHVRSSG